MKPIGATVKYVIEGSVLFIWHKYGQMLNTEGARQGRIVYKRAWLKITQDQKIFSQYSVS